MSVFLIAQQGADLEAQICAAFDRMKPSEVSLFVWLPTAQKLFEALRSPRVEFFDDEVDIADGYTVELFPIRYSPRTMDWLLRQLGVIQ